MNKRQLAQRMATISELSQKQCEMAIKAFMEITKECFHNNEKIFLTSFGTFIPTVKKARRGVNPSTHELMTIPERKVLKFKISKTF